MQNNTQAFQEEEKHLQRIHNEITDVVKSKKADLSYLEKSHQEAIAFGDDSWFKGGGIEHTKKIQGEIEQAQRLAKDPYFSHIEVESDQATESLFIGKNGFDDSRHDPIIVNWQAPIASIYYQKSQRKFSVNGIHYTLKLRREVTIEDGNLFRVYTNYDSRDTKTAEIVDPFLLEVIKDKRRSHTTTDIITSIQELQYKIISLDFKKNLIVQGCAGSGKTMILFHRLTYLIFNTKQEGFDFRNNTRIILPSASFKLFVDPLSKELKLNQISQSTLEQFYSEIISRFTNKLNTDPDKLLPDDLLSEDIRKYVYTQNFATRLREEYDKYFDKSITKICEANPEIILPLIKKYIGNEKINGFTGVTKLSQVTSEIRQKVRNFDKEVASAKERLQSRIDNVLRELEDEKNELQNYSEEPDSDKSEAAIDLLNKTIEFVASLTITENAPSNPAKRRFYPIPKTFLKSFLIEITGLQDRYYEAMGRRNKYAELLEVLISSEKSLSPDSIFANVFRAIYQKRVAEFGSGEFRFELYLKLLLCSFYFGRHTVPLFVCIDEAQNVHDSEYKAIRDVLSEKTIFNLYGDIQQRINEYDGLKDWKSIDGSWDYYELNDNYRNTIQVTDCCNKQFHTAMKPLGLNGPEIICRDNFSDALTDFVGKFTIGEKESSSSPERFAIIYSGNPEEKHLLEENLRGSDYCWKFSNERKINILSVGSSHGLEFENVLVLSDQMSDGAKYIAYTRSLNYLSIVDKPLSTVKLFDEQTKTTNKIEPIIPPVNKSKLQVGEIVRFGHYPQPQIEWIVLKAEPDRALLISKYGLMTQPYNSTDANIAWKTCTLRKWLNYEFVENAFAGLERNMIFDSNYYTGNTDKKYKESAESDDKIFILDICTAKDLFSGDKRRECTPSDFAKMHKAYTAKGKARWWLSSPGLHGNTAAYVNPDGSINENGLSVTNNNCTVRPACWLNLDLCNVSDIRQKGARQIEPNESKIKEMAYQSAVKLMSNKKFKDALETFLELREYKDSAKYEQTCKDELYGEKYIDAQLLALDGKYFPALKSFTELDDYKDSKERAEKCRLTIYSMAEKAMSAGEYVDAMQTFSKLGEYKDSAEKLQYCKLAFCEKWYQEGLALMAHGDFDNSYKIFGKIIGYKDTALLRKQARITMLRNASKGSIIRLGSYWQDSDKSTGEKNIEWIVLEKEKDKVLLISRFILDADKYNKTRETVDWESCTLRKWLNNQFIKNAFDADESEMIIPINNSDNHSKPNSKSLDHIFLLSVFEMSKYSSLRISQRCPATEYAKKKGFMSSNKDYKWWVRSPKSDSCVLACYDGSISRLGDYVDVIHGIRPAMWVSMD